MVQFQNVVDCKHKKETKALEKTEHYSCVPKYYATVLSGMHLMHADAGLPTSFCPIL